MFSIETKLLIKNGLQKFLLREVSKKLLPPTVSNSKKKVGFNASIHSLIDIKKNIDWLLAESRIFDIISRKKFEQILKRILLGMIILNFFLVLFPQKFLSIRIQR